MRRLIGSFMVAVVLSATLAVPTLGKARIFRLDMLCSDTRGQQMDLSMHGVTRARVKHRIRTVRRTAGTGPVDVMDSICETMPPYTISRRVDGVYVVVKHVD